MPQNNTPIQKVPFTKVPFTYEEHIKLLKDRGLTITDENRAMRYLREINYFRISAYFVTFQEVKDTFNTNTNFSDILDIYLFDRKLRLLVFDAIERIEVALRSQIIYQLSHKYGAHWQDNSNIFKGAYTDHRNGRRKGIYQGIQDSIKTSMQANHPEIFIKHYSEKYLSPENPPSWMCIELLSIGELSRLYMALKSNADRKDISLFFNLHHKVFTNWLHTLVYVRNLCAHHSRLWNREFSIKPIILLNSTKNWIDPIFNENKHRTFYFLSIIKYLLIAVNPNNHFKQKFFEIIDRYPSVPIQFLGIPTNSDGEMIDWKNEPLWK